MLVKCVVSLIEGMGDVSISRCNWCVNIGIKIMCVVCEGCLCLMVICFIVLL